jgi:hypothetical protein
VEEMKVSGGAGCPFILPIGYVHFLFCLIGGGITAKYKSSHSYDQDQYLLHRLLVCF